MSLSTSTSKEAREVELAWMHSVCWILTVAAKEVAARAAMVAKVKPFILMVLWCWGVVVWCGVVWKRVVVLKEERTDST